MANAQWALAKWGLIEPYLYAGLGVDYFKKVSSGFGGQIGIGLEYPLDRHYSFFIETKAEGGFGFWAFDLNPQLSYQWADLYFPVMLGVKCDFPFTADAGKPESAPSSSVSTPQPGSGASSRQPSQRWVVEADYGAPLLQGFSVGYCVDSRWETSVGFSIRNGYNFQASYSVPNGVNFQGPPTVPVEINYFRLSVLGRYNLTERKDSRGNFFQPYLSFGYDVTWFTQESTYIFDEIGGASEQDLQLGLGLEYFLLPDLGAGFTVHYIHPLVVTDAPLNPQSPYYLPYLPWNSPSLTEAFPIDPNFYLQFRF